jgi:UPF0716 protein FxsA
VPLVAFVLLVVAPAVELFVVIEVAHAIGWSITLFLLLAFAFLGVVVMRRAGSSWWQSLRAGAAAGQVPDGRAAAHSALLFLAGLLLFLPGFVSDIVGLLLLLPPVRALLLAGTTAWFVRRFTSVTAPGGARIWTRQDGVIQGEVIREDVPPPDPDSRNGRSGGGEPPGLPPAS